MSRAAALIVLATLAATPTLAAEVVPVPQFQTIQLRGGGSVTVRPGPVQRVTLLEGSREFTTFRMERDGKLTIDACNRQCPRNYSLRIDVQSPSVPNVAIMGGGAIVAAAGFAPQSQLSAAINGGGNIDLRSLAAHNVSAAINGGGNINLRSVAARNVNAAINGGGRILAGKPSALSVAVRGGGEVRYSGNPQLQTAIAGGGSVRRDN